jgi:hypothetical protein
MHALVVLFVRADSIYKTLPGVECYDEARDARTWPGGCPVVAHPPCRTWGCLKAFATKAPPHEHALGPWAVEQVRRWGGVLEHPKGSTLFRECGCPVPFGLPDQWGGQTIEVDQWAWGHKARKATLLYIVGLPTNAAWLETPKRDGRPTHCVGRPGGPRKPGQIPCCTHEDRERTPPAFAAWLVELARRCSKHNAEGHGRAVARTVDPLVRASGLEE